MVAMANKYMSSAQSEIDSFAKDVAHLGFPCLKYMYVPSFEVFDQPDSPKFVLLSNMPEDPNIDWTLSGGADDPVRREVLSSPLPTVWRCEKGKLCLPDVKKLSEDQETALSLLLGTGLDAGVVVPVGTHNAAVSFYIPEGAKFVKKLPQSTLERLFFTAYQLHDQLSSYVEDWKSETRSISLTPREKECLEWSGHGKNSWEIAKILCLSQDTVRDYLKHAAKKLDCVTRTQAVVKAMHMDLIQVTPLI